MTAVSAAATAAVFLPLISIVFVTAAAANFIDFKLDVPAELKASGEEFGGRFRRSPAGVAEDGRGGGEDYGGVLCAHKCAASAHAAHSVVNAAGEKHAFTCETLHTIRNCTKSCGDEKFARFVNANLRHFDESLCARDDGADGFALLAREISICEMKLRKSDKNVPSHLWNSCLSLIKPKTTEDLCLAFSRCVLVNVERAINEECRAVNVTAFYAFELKTTFAAKCDMFGPRVMPKSCLEIYNVPE